MALYLKHFGLYEAPFSITPDPRYLFLSVRHKEALAHLFYGIQEKGGIIQLTGEVGTGKTMVTRALLAQLPEATEVALILNPMVSALELLETICDELHIERPAEATVKRYIDLISAYLLQAYSAGKRVVLLIDEAQNLKADVIEQVRLLTNIETEREKLLQIILVGQPELTQLLNQDNLRQVWQRVTARYHLESLNFFEVRSYLKHRLEVAGVTRSIFSLPALLMLWRRSKGIPRRVNIIADRALLGGYARGSAKISLFNVARAASEVSGRGKGGKLKVALLAILLLLLGTMFVAGTEIAREQWLEGFLSKVGLQAATMAAKDLQSNEIVPRQVGIAVIDTDVIKDTAKDTVKDVVEDFSKDLVTQSATSVVELNQNHSYIVAVEQLSAPSELSMATQSSLPPQPSLPPKLKQLGDVWQQQGMRTDLVAAFTDLFRIWGYGYAVTPGSTSCVKASGIGLQCYFFKASIDSAIALNRPAILRFVVGNGYRYGLLLGAEQEWVTLSFAGVRLQLPRQEVAKEADAEIITLWRPPETSARLFKPKMEGADFNWLVNLFKQIDVEAFQVTPTTYDATVETWVRDFQQQFALGVDGVVGEQTLVYLLARLNNSLEPRLEATLAPSAKE